MTAEAPTFIDTDVGRIVLATAVGLFLGLEREWSSKAAGVRTFALVATLSAVAVTLGRTVGATPVWVALGGGVVLVHAAALGVRGLRGEGGLALTTGVSLMVAYGAGALVGAGLLLEGVTVGVLSAVLLVFKRELHSFAGGLSREELRSTAEFAVLAFVVYPLLPAGSVTVGVPSVTVEPRVVWLMVVTVAGIGVVNYAVVRTYGGRGVVVSGFFGGLASSTAVVGTMLDQVRQDPSASSYALAAVLLADAAMAVRNLVIVLAFTAEGAALVGVVVPLLAVAVGGVALAAWVADWGHGPVLSADGDDPEGASERAVTDGAGVPHTDADAGGPDDEVPTADADGAVSAADADGEDTGSPSGSAVDLGSPFSLRNALAFGAVFAVVVLVGAFATAGFGDAGFVVAAAASSLVSSAGATTSAVALYRTGAVGADAATLAVLAATVTSIGVKSGLTFLGGERAFARRVTVWSAALVAVAVAGVGLALWT